MTTSNDENRETFSVTRLDNDGNVFETNIVEQQQIRSFINRLKTFDDIEQCEQYIRLMSEDDRVVFIVCAQLGQEIIPRLENLRQLTSIYVYYIDSKEKEEWIIKNSKLVLIEFAELASQIKTDYSERKHLAAQEPLQLIDVLLRMKPTLTDKNELIDICKKEYENNHSELTILREFEQTYSSVKRSDDLQKILFEIDAEVHSHIHQKLFANVNALSYFPNEDEVLFIIGSVFRLKNIRLEDRVWLIEMTLCSDDDHDLNRLSEHMKREYGIGELSFIKVGHVLADMGKLNQADQYYRRLLNELPSNSSTVEDIATLYSSLGIIASEKGDYNRSLDWHNKSLDIRIRANRFNHTEICNTLSSIGDTHRINGNLQMALESHNKALTLFMKAHGENHPRMPGFLCNIGIVCQCQGKHTEALNSYEKALHIQEKYLPPNHPELAIYYNNIGIFHHILKHYDLALEYFNMALKIKLKSLTPQHPQYIQT